ncbi:hypothetical protein ASE87_01125 [Frigoribacterium sp. Leaf44]|nr:hypothetical protein ASE87_01125 [Frigoribacterium sp. Leaf44]
MVTALHWGGADHRQLVAVSIDREVEDHHSTDGPNRVMPCPDRPMAPASYPRPRHLSRCGCGCGCG